MERIFNSRFIRIVFRGQKRDYDPNYLLTAYTDFKTQLLSVSDDEHNYRGKFRTIKSLRELLELHIQSERFQNERGENIQAFASLALRQVAVELDLLEKQLQYPDLFTLTANSPQPSPLHWNTNKFSKRDLIELASALYASQAVVDNDGRPISFIQLAQGLASTMNIQFPNNTIYNEREYIRSVKRNTTAFISQLASALSEKSRK